MVRKKIVFSSDKFVEKLLLVISDFDHMLAVELGGSFCDCGPVCVSSVLFVELIQIGLCNC